MGACLVVFCGELCVSAARGGNGLGKFRVAERDGFILRVGAEGREVALAKCDEGGYRVSVAVVDRGGNLKALLRGDDAGSAHPGL